ncbi:MAG: sirohydrochlorin chelatase [Proteobacteria bacterium]|nr:sirohydrochlorin chelatase [Pseudomonadota bacterium]
MTTDTILLVGHGSREPSGNEQIEHFAAQWRARYPQWRTELCFIEFAEVDVEHGLDLAARGSRRVVVVPLILNAAGHVNVEIPSHMARARQRHPGLRFDYAPHLGVCEPVLDVLKRQLRQCMRTLDMPDPTGTGIVLLGRGSSSREANGEMARMARWLFEAGDHEVVDLAFTGIAWPRLERVVQRQAQQGLRQIVVLPYYLFTGTLMQRIGRQVAHLRTQYPQLRFALGSYFGFEPEIAELLAERVGALLDGTLDAVPVGDEAAHWQGHHHHHHDHHDHDHAQHGH